MLIEMQIDRHAVALRRIEQHVHEGVGLVGNCRRATDHIGTGSNGAFQPFFRGIAKTRRAGGDKRHHLDAHPVTPASAKIDQHVHRATAQHRIDIGVGADGDSTARKACGHRAVGTFPQALRRDPRRIIIERRYRAEQRPRRVRHVAQRPGLVEMLMAIDQTRRNQLVAEIDDFGCGRRGEVRAEAFDPPVGTDRHVDPLRTRATGPQHAAAAQQERLRCHLPRSFPGFFLRSLFGRFFGRFLGGFFRRLFDGDFHALLLRSRRLGGGRFGFRLLALQHVDAQVLVAVDPQVMPGAHQHRHVLALDDGRPLEAMSWTQFVAGIDRDRHERLALVQIDLAPLLDRARCIGAAHARLGELRFRQIGDRLYRQCHRLDAGFGIGRALAVAQFVEIDEAPDDALPAIRRLQVEVGDRHAHRVHLSLEQEMHIAGEMHLADRQALLLHLRDDAGFQRLEVVADARQIEREAHRVRHFHDALGVAAGNAIGREHRGDRGHHDLGAAEHR